ncbi:MAG: hypothetical protein A2758_00835 [Candidatus Zambryskibacteria bacterium RIFCSPHIGHO2_01_FULL_49_18]|uniref:Uncharacterized protein n=2 Tax=Candidatus Zambryskiibacteriota TaxID=1817925 RepID=A0A1G2T2W8_9BACT|nr:MAG: hypothetical protein A2758_00835 [Candidatus Zambryskibacteria bacterium RIFCSPHIGHO2_01_FULL_49_18]OHB05748.1 MAG: hypothetical protein A3A26_03645 [Candidatus Zambryskibacteria bacterium RIFCSPLOWO2_01_FULL_47_14]
MLRLTQTRAIRPEGGTMKATMFSVHRDRCGTRFLMFEGRGVSIPNRVSDRMAITHAAHQAYVARDEAHLETLLMRVFWVNA